MIVGIGVDMVNVPKFSATMRAAPTFSASVFTDTEARDESGARRSESSLAARYAAKEALCKALGAPRGVSWHECEVLTGEQGQPYLRVTGVLAEAQRARGVGSCHVSLSTEGDMAVAYVVAEGVEAAAA